MTTLSLSVAPIAPGAVPGALPALAGRIHMQGTGHLLQDYRYSLPSIGVVANSVAYRVDPGAPEQPFVGARVWLFRELDGFKAWEGWSGAGGEYIATRLEPGVAYVPVAIDVTGNFECVAAGPVVAVAADA